VDASTATASGPRRIIARIARVVLSAKKKLTRVWTETGPALRTALVVLPTAGGVLFLLSLWGDVVGFWTDKPFLTNVSSSVISALFGIPFALVILQRLSIDQASRLERLAVRRLAARAAEELAASAASTVGCTYSRGENPRFGPSYELLSTMNQMLDGVVRFVSFFDEPEGLTGVTKVSDRCSVSPEQADQFLGVIESASDEWLAILGQERDLRRHIGQMSSRFEFLTGPVRTRILESGLPWVDVSIVEECGRLLGEIEKTFPKAWLPGIVGRIKDEFTAASVSRSELFYATRSSERMLTLSYNFFIDMNSQLQNCLQLVLLLVTFAEKSENFSKGLVVAVE
jgi:hypothetical protein